MRVGGVDAIDSRAIPTSTRKRTHVVLAITAGTDIFESIQVLCLMGMPQVIDAVLAMDAFIKHTRRLGAVPSLQTGN